MCHIVNIDFFPPFFTTNASKLFEYSGITIDVTGDVAVYALYYKGGAG